MGQRVISAILTLRDRDFSSNLQRASDRADDFGRGITRVGNQIQRFGQGATRVFQTVGAGAAALGAAGLTALGVGVAKSIVDTDGAFKRLEARTGATGAELKGLENVAKDVFKAGFGENMDQVADDVSTLSAMFKDLKGSALTEVAKGAATISQAWGAESKEVGKTVKSMTSNFKGLSETKALDLMTHAFQKTGDYSDDLLDTFNEYSVHFSKLGMSAEDFTGILIKGAENGAWNMDKVGDAVKEFGIRAIDGSKGTKEGFDAIGLNADEMAKKFTAGGDTANNAFAATIAGLAAMKNPVEQNAAGVALFGTMWEDLREDVVLSMSDSASAVKGFEGSTGRAADALQSSFKSKLTQSWRELQVGIADVVNGAGAQEFLASIAQKADELVPKIQGIVQKAFEFGNTIRDNWGPIKETVITLGSAVGAFAVGMGALKVITTVTTMIQGFRTAMGLATAGQWAMNTAMLASPLTWVVVGIAAVIAIGVALYRNWDTVKAKAGELWAKTTEVFGGIYDWAAQKIQPVTSFFKSLYDKFIDFKNAITSFKPPEWVSKIGGAIGKGIGAVKNFVAGSHATGLNSVPYDGYIAELHKGEMIIPQRQSERIRQAGGTIDNVDQMMGQQPTVTTNTVTTTTTNNTETAGKGAISIVIENIHAKGVTVAEVINELVPLLKLHLSNI